MTAQVRKNREMDERLIRLETEPEPGRPAALDIIVSSLVSVANTEQCRGAVKFKDVHGVWHHVKISYTFEGRHPSIAMTLEIVISTEVHKVVKGAGRISEWQDVPRTLVFHLDEGWFVAECVYGTNLAKTGLTAIKKAMDNRLSPLERHAMRVWVGALR